MALGDRRVMDRTPGEVRRPPRSFRESPVVCWTIIAASAYTMALEIFAGSDMKERFWLMPAEVGDQWWRVLTTMVVHGNPIHLLLNMSVVWTVGFQLERAIGSARFLVISLVTALGSSTFVLFFSPPDIPTVGASGMIIGWIGAMLFIVRPEARQSFVIWLVQIAVISFLPGVSWQGHLGGFIFGLPCGFLLRDRARYFNVGAPVVLMLAVLAAVAGLSHVGARLP